MTGQKKATKPAKKAFINATTGIRGLIAGFVRPILEIPEPNKQR